ncbi:MAG: hypothetical protein RDV48_10565 [Candidatus Eremiobacteraeota bacterium]|nr:hypothetical protein [Candidatus Eremiobacteraeota bacterium]
MKNIMRNRFVQLLLLLALVTPLMGFTAWTSYGHSGVMNYKYGQTWGGELWAYPPVNGYLCADFPWHNPPVYDVADYFGHPRHEFGFGVRITPYFCLAPMDTSQVYLAVIQFVPPLSKYNIKWTVKGGDVIREWGEHNEYIRVKLNDPKMEIYAEIPPTNMRDIYYLKYHRP